MANSRGSEWRKWDLHVHTPESIFHQYGGNGDEVWEKYIAALENLPAEIKVLGINDYLFIDGYRKVLEYKKEGRLQNIDLLLPVVEFRLAKFCGNEKFKKINYHVIFSNEVDPDVIQGQFLSALTHSYVLSPDHKKYWSGVISKTSLADLGKKIIDSVPAEQRAQYNTPLIEGFNNLNLEESSILEKLEQSSYFTGKYITAIGKTEWDDFKWNDNSIADKKQIIDAVDIVFTAAENIESYNKSKQKLCCQGVNSLLLDCSDAHYFADVDVKDRLGNCNTWIKADTTFEGLKQILFEPDERVCVQLEKPDYKSKYQVIDSISLDEKSFWNDTIYLNSNLNTIIGGRSTGKSTLLNAIACKLGCPIDEVTQKEGYDDYIGKHLDGVTIHWRDELDGATRDVDYYPQSYMYQIASDERKLDGIICSNIMGDKTDVLDKYTKSNNQLEVYLHTTILSLFQEQEKYKSLRSQLREKGDKSTISKEIGDLEVKVKSLTDQTQITETEIERYKADTETLSQIEQKNNAIHRDITTLESLINAPILASNFPQKYDVLSENTREHLIKVYSDIAKIANEQWVNQIKEILQVLRTEQDNNRKQYNAIKNASLYIKCKQYYDDNKELNSIQTRLREEQKKLHEFEEQETICNKCKQEIDNLVKKIVDQYVQFQKNTDTVCKELFIKQDDLTIEAHTIFLWDDLYDFLKERFNIRSAEKQKYIEKLADEYAEQSTIEDYIRKALNSEFAYKSTHSAQEVMTDLLSQNWYKYKFDVIYQDDKFSKMSQGKQAFVVLKLLLEFSKKPCPILIDQPEDSLDNRAIYKDLVEYIRNKKKERQIILVTHNPNVVVSADAENVIVANQNGNNSPNQNGVKFHYINGSLENSKDKNACVESILESQGVREHVCEILEGGKEAFEKREKKYGFR